MTTPNGWRDIPAIVDRTLWDSMGNKARIELYRTGPASFEVFASRMNQAVPDRRCGTLGECINWGQVWCDARKAEGFIEAQPMDNPNAINV